jgi:hypothetical protein
MRLIKMFGLAAIAAVAAMAFVGASSASANGSTALCKVNQLVCPAASIFTGHVEALSTQVVIKGPLNVTCTHSIILGEALGLAKPLIIHVTELDFLNCNCPVTVSDSTGLLEALKTASNLATSTAEGFVIEMNCSGVNCKYGGFAQAVHVVGGNPLTIKAVEIEPKLLSGSSFFCFGAPGFWTAEYKVTLPTGGLFISE